MEQQNDQQIEILDVKVEELRGLTDNLRRHFQDEKAILADLDDGMGSNKTFLSGSAKRLSAMIAGGGSRHMCYLIYFMLIVFFFIYRMISN